MPDVTYPVTIDTIGKMLAHGYELTVYCSNDACHHRQRVNLVALARRLGMNHPSTAQHLQPKFYCSHCREAGRPDRNISMICTPSGYAKSEYPRQNAYLKAKGG